MRHLFFICFVALSVGIYAQQQTHSVKRGETMAIIASKYGITVEELKSANPLTKKLYMGMKIKIPSKSQLTISPSNSFSNTKVVKTESNVSRASTGEEISRPALAYIGFAEKYMKAGQHKKAIKELNKSLKEQDNITARWMRGQCYYYEGKWKKALEDLVLVRSNSKMPLSVQEAARNMYAHAEAQQEAIKAEKKQFWGEMLASVGLATLQAGQQAMYTQQMQSYQPTTGSASNYNLDMQKIWNNAAIETQQKTQQDFHNFQQMVYRTTGTMPTWEDYGKALAEANSNKTSATTGTSSLQEFNDKLDADAAKRTDNNYRKWYRDMEKLVESHYRSLTTSGYRGIDNSGKIVGGVSEHTIQSSGYIQLKPLFIKRQRELIELRKKAARNGVTITPSQWETAVVY